MINVPVNSSKRRSPLTWGRGGSGLGSSSDSQGHPISGWTLGELNPVPDTPTSLCKSAPSNVQWPGWPREPLVGLSQ